MLLDMTVRKNVDSGRAELRKIIKDKCFQEGAFILSSGKKSNVFFNLKPAMLDPHALNLLADEVIKATETYDADYIGGMVMGAAPILLSVVVKSNNTPRPLKGFWVRKEKKPHGMRQLIDGDIKSGDKVIVVDDVTTSGESILQAIHAVKDRGCRTACVLTIVDRCEGAQEALSREGFKLNALFTRYDFTDKSPEDVLA